MRNGTILSILFHVSVIAALALGLPTFVTPLPQIANVPVELITLAELEAAAVDQPDPEPEPAAKEEAPEPEPEKKETPPPPEPKPTPAPIPEPEPAPAPEPVPEPEPAPEPEPTPEPEPEPVPEPEPTPEPKPEPEPEPEKQSKPVPPKPRPRPQIKVATPEKPEEKKQEKPPADALTSILRNVEKLKKQPVQKKQTATAPKVAEQPKQQQQVSRIAQDGIVRAIRQQIQRCWRLDPGAQQAENLVVEIRITLRRDGTLISAEVVDMTKMFGDAYYRSAAENARRAIQACSPYKLPVQDYDIWRVINLKFDPREMFGT
jgi:outer membrane biosynthesis protein TonB